MHTSHYNLKFIKELIGFHKSFVNKVHRSIARIDHTLNQGLKQQGLQPIRLDKSYMEEIRDLSHRTNDVIEYV